MRWDVRHGHVLDELQKLKDGLFDCAITSPPYYGLRSYGTPVQLWGANPKCPHLEYKGTDFREVTDPLKGWRCTGCGAWKGELGQEPTPDEYVAHLVEVMREVRRVLRKDGTLWLNLADTFAGSGKGQTATGCASPKVKRTLGMKLDVPDVPEGMKPKDLMGIPWAVAFALRADGWWLRSEIIWHKTNVMPENVTDRPTRAHEHLFLLAKSQHYHFDQDAVRVPNLEDSKRRAMRGSSAENKYAAGNAPEKVHPNTMSQPRPYRGYGEMEDAIDRGETHLHPLGRNIRTVWSVPTAPNPDDHFASYPERLLHPCIKAGSRIGKLVLDPFCGTGTTGVAALSLQRDFLGIELLDEYVEIARRRIGQTVPLFATEGVDDGAEPADEGMATSAEEPPAAPAGTPPVPAAAPHGRPAPAPPTGAGGLAG